MNRIHQRQSVKAKEALLFPESRDKPAMKECQPEALLACRYEDQLREWWDSHWGTGLLENWELTRER